MPKRMLDGESLWSSDKIRALPAQFRPEFANILPLALPDGVFECDPHKVWARVYSYNRKKITVDFVRDMLDAFEQVGLISRGTYNGHIWGYFKGIEKPGRLPKPSHRSRYECSGLPANVIAQMRDQLPPLTGVTPPTDGSDSRLHPDGVGEGRVGVVRTASRKAKSNPVNSQLQNQEEKEPTPAKPALVN